MIPDPKRYLAKQRYEDAIKALDTERGVIEVIYDRLITVFQDDSNAQEALKRRKSLDLNIFDVFSKQIRVPETATAGAFERAADSATWATLFVRPQVDALYRWKNSLIAGHQSSSRGQGASGAASGNTTGGGATPPEAPQSSVGHVGRSELLGYAPQAPRGDEGDSMATPAPSENGDSAEVTPPPGQPKRSSEEYTPLEHPIDRSKWSILEERYRPVLIAATDSDQDQGATGRTEDGGDASGSDVNQESGAEDGVSGPPNTDDDSGRGVDDYDEPTRRVFIPTPEETLLMSLSSGDQFRPALTPGGPTDQGWNGPSWTPFQATSASRTMSARGVTDGSRGMNYENPFAQNPIGGIAPGGSSGPTDTINWGDPRNRARVVDADAAIGPFASDTNAHSLYAARVAPRARIALRLGPGEAEK